MKKVCSVCNQERDAELDFNWRNKERRIRQTRCKFCQSLISKNHYKHNKESYLHRIRTREILVIEDNRRKIAHYLSQHPCVDCGRTNIRVLEFDHVRGNKSNNIARMVQNGLSWSTIEAEIAKCEVRCANCHRIKTAERSSSWRQLFSL